MGLHLFSAVCSCLQSFLVYHCKYITSSLLYTCLHWNCDMQQLNRALLKPRVRKCSKSDVSIQVLFKYQWSTHRLPRFVHQFGLVLEQELYATKASSDVFKENLLTKIFSTDLSKPLCNCTQCIYNVQNLFWFSRYFELQSLLNS